MQSRKLKCDLAPKLNTITRKPCRIKHCRHTVKVKTNSLYHRPKRSSNKIRILKAKYEFEKNEFNIPYAFTDFPWYNTASEILHLIQLGIIWSCYMWWNSLLVSTAIILSALSAWVVVFSLAMERRMHSSNDQNSTGISYITYTT